MGQSGSLFPELTYIASDLRTRYDDSSQKLPFEVLVESNKKNNPYGGDRKGCVPKWSLKGSNLGPSDYESDALTN